MKYMTLITAFLVAACLQQGKKEYALGISLIFISQYLGLQFSNWLSYTFDILTIIRVFDKESKKNTIYLTKRSIKKNYKK
jgi:hypothetical protein